MARYNPRTASANESSAITANDTTTFAPTRAVYVGVTGDLTVQHVAGGASVLYSNVPVGVFPVSVVRVMSTGTTASGLVGMY